MTEGKCAFIGKCDSQKLELTTRSDPDEGKDAAATEDSQGTYWEVPSLQELVEILHSAPKSCRHGDEVWANLFLGDMFLSHDKFGLYQLGITHVLNASHGKLCCKGNEDFYGTTVKYYGVAANDLPTFDLSPFFYPAAEFIHHALTSGGTVWLKMTVVRDDKRLCLGAVSHYFCLLPLPGRILVHCAVGVSRSAALVLAYLMIYHHLSLVSSVRCVQQKRWICPNRGFLRQLIGLDKKLREQSVNVLMQH
uniref:Dual specificity protein phosphatase 13-like n=1 Tax=Gouania willdenowi TaxID=441366 RepID=A0A8C5H8Q4_GOUWI